MMISKEELEKIKQLNQAKESEQILKAGEDLEDEDNKQDDSDDENFISNRASDGKKSDIKPVNSDIRSLDDEIGGAEVDYKKSQEEANQDVDIWDDREAQIDQGSQEAATEDVEVNKSFIHKIKTGIFKGKKKAKSMGQVDLGQFDLGQAAAEMQNEKPASFVQKLQQLREDKSHSNDGGITF